MDSNYNEHEYDFNHNSTDDIDEEMTVDDLINELELQLDKFNDNVVKLWQSVIYDYINDHNKNYILNKLNVFDSTKFYVFVTENSPQFKQITNSLNELYKCKAKGITVL
jgi:hypothetical protein